jgi:hypothetical protein
MTDYFMTKAFAARFSFALLFGATLMAVSLTAAAAKAQNQLYNPIPMPPTKFLTPSQTKIFQSRKEALPATTSLT